MDVIEELKILGNSQKIGGVGGRELVGGSGSWGGQGGCERRIEVFGKIYKKNREGGRFGGGGGGGGSTTTSGFEIHLAKHYYIAITKYE